ncbi:MAG: hypothetical protein JRI68_34640, partial [Deltaproteobacteria bacterium]|nr:hypothetical protein [Deltaproteobacteria bacterium]
PLLSLLFYLGILEQLLALLSANLGWKRAPRCLWHLFGSVAFSALPLVVAAGFGVYLERATGRSRRALAIQLGLSTLVVPAAFVLLVASTPYPRVFVIFLPAWIYALTALVRRALAWLSIGRSARQVRMLHLVLLTAVVGWGVATRDSPSLRPLFAASAAEDDLVAPRYMAGFEPDRLARRVAALYSQDPAVKVYLYLHADPFSVILQGMLYRVPDSVWLYDRYRTQILPEEIRQPLYGVATREEELQGFIRRYALRVRVGRVEDFGMQKLYRLLPAE